MRRYSASTIAPWIIVVGVFAVVGYANWREGRRSRVPFTTPLSFGSPGVARTTRQDLERRVADLDRRLTSHPNDIGSSLLLADALMRQTRVTGNIGLSKRAEQLLVRARTEDPSNYDVLRMMGSLFLSEHRFREAVDAGEQASRMRPYDSVNYGVIGDGHLELGEYPEAFAAFDHMMTLRPSASSYARVSYARELQGDLAGSVHAMQMAADATAADDAEGLAWTRSQLGELYFQLGRLSEAEEQFTLASHAFPGHPFSVAGYAKILAARGDLNGAVGLLTDLERRTPTPDLEARLGDLLALQGHHDDAERRYALAESAWRVDAPEPKNLARFLADHDRKLDEAVQIAQTAAAARRDIFTMDALSWAYFKAGHLSEAAEASRDAMRTGTRDRILLFHAAAITHAQQDDREARRLDDLALTGNPQFDLVAAPAARHLRDELARAPRVASR